MKVLICFFSLFLCLILVSCNHNFIKKETKVTKVEPSHNISTEVLDNTSFENNLDNFNEISNKIDISPELKDILKKHFQALNDGDEKAFKQTLINNSPNTNSNQLIFDKYKNSDIYIKEVMPIDDYLKFEQQFINNTFVGVILEIRADITNEDKEITFFINLIYSNNEWKINRYVFENDFNKMELLQEEGWSSDAFIAATNLLSQYPTLFLNKPESDNFLKIVDEIYNGFMYYSEYRVFDINNDGKPIIIITCRYYEGTSNHLFVFKDGKYQENKEFITSNSARYEIYTDKQDNIVLIETFRYDGGGEYSHIINCDGNLKKEIIYDNSKPFIDDTFNWLDLLSNLLIIEPSLKELSPLSSKELFKICREMINELTIQPQLLIDGKLTSLEYPIVIDNEIPLISIDDLKHYFDFSIFRIENGLILQRENYENYYEVGYNLTEGWSINDKEQIKSPVDPQIINDIWYVPIDFTLNSLSYTSIWIESLNIQYTRTNSERYAYF